MSQVKKELQKQAKQEEEEEEEHQQQQQQQQQDTNTSSQSEEDIIVVILKPADDSAQIEVRSKRKTKIEKLINAYAKQKNINPNSLRFYLDGNRLTAQQTLSSANINDGDQIDVMIEQVGGQTPNYRNPNS